MELIFKNVYFRCRARSFLLGAIIILAALTPVWAVTASAGAAREVQIVDGDTLMWRGERVRLHGIDAPEADQSCTAVGGDYPCGQMAFQWLVEKTNKKEVRCEKRGRDRYGRLLAVCFAGEVNLNRGLVEAGLAMAYRRYSAEFAAAEDAARRDGLGLWAGTFVPPWQWRQGTRLALASGPEEACPVKGNVSRDKRIYHMPGGQHYESLQLDPAEGDRCFQTESEAIAAGFRAPKR
ncbi:MAG: thermonuclease family protein [Candidatus Binatia bacterium]